MRSTRRVSLLVGLLLVTVPWPGAAQSGATSPAPVVLTPAEMETFLLKAKVVGNKKMKKGVTNARRVTLSDGQVTHDAQIQDVDIALPIFNVDPKHTEVNFKDSYRYNIAAYRLAVMLGLDNVPMSVERVVDGKPSAVTWWLDDVAMDEGDKKKNNVVSSNPERTSDYYDIMRVFDELIQNRDRNAGNIMWSSDWRMWMIDHTRAFRLDKKLLQPEVLRRGERTLLDKIRGLRQPAFTEAVGKTLTKGEIEALFARRDLLVKRFDEQIASRGEAAVLYTVR